jgi:hypothetical protein
MEYSGAGGKLIHEKNQKQKSCDTVPKRDSVTRFFASDFFRESSFPKPLIIALGSFRIFSKIRGDICKCRCTTGINDTGGKFATNTAVVSLIPAGILLPVSLIPEVHLDLRIDD